MKKFKVVYLFILSLVLIGCTGQDNIEIFKFVTLEHEIHIGETINLQLIMGQYPEDSVVQYTFSEEDIISFENGTAKGLKEGNVDVTATVDNLIFATTKVIVLKQPVDSMQIIGNSTNENPNVLYLGEQLQLDIKVSPDNLSKEVKWSIEKVDGIVSDVATITADGLLISSRAEKNETEFLAGGAKVRVVATYVDDETVQAKKDFFIRYKPTTVLTLSSPADKTEFTFDDLDGISSIKLTAGSAPEGSYPIVSYTSSDSTVAEIDETGLVTFPEVLKAGSTTFTVTTLDKKTAKLTITISAPVEPEEPIEP